MMYVNTPPTIGGINARDPKSQMSPTDAIGMINLMPNGETVKTRGGSKTVLAQNLSTVDSNSFFPEFKNIVVQNLSGDIETLVEYDAGNTAAVTADSENVNPTRRKDNKLIVGAGEKIWSYDGTASELGSGFTSARWQTVHFDERLILVNGNDSPQTYDGTTLTASTFTLQDSSGAAATDSPSELWGANVFKGRVYYWTLGKQYFYYCQAGSYQGITKQFDLSMQIKQGGYLVTIQTYARDSGSGLDDYIVFIFSTGETLVYQGDDPESADAWSLVNRYSLAPPIDIRGFLPLGGDVIMLTLDGWQNLSTALPNQRISNKGQIGEKIINLAQKNASQHNSKFGWGITSYPKGGMLIINVPISGNKSVQHVMDTRSGSWTTFRGWNAKCFCTLNDDLYFADEHGNIRQADVGTSDNGQFIVYKVRPAYQDFGSQAHRKQVNGVQVITNYRHPKYIHLDVNSDYNDKQGKPFVYPPEYGTFDWDESNWDQDYWADDEESEEETGVKPRYKMCFGWGYSISILMRFASRTQTITWYSTNIKLRKLGGR